MTITIGSRLPDAKFIVMSDQAPAAKTTDEIFGGKKVVLFAVPGAFTPTCHRNHLPGFIEHADAFRAKGVDEIVCTAVNDIFVLSAWASATGAEGKMMFISDGNGDFAKAVGLDADRTAANMGIRSQRYSMLVEDGVVTLLNIEETSRTAEVSGAPALLQAM